MKEHKFRKCIGIGKEGTRCDPSVPHCEICGRQKYDCENINQLYKK